MCIVKTDTFDLELIRVKILMVCLGNICRSPIAHGILQARIQSSGLDWSVDSAGTSSFHNGEAPHTGSIQIAAENGIDISGQRSRLFVKQDFKKYDLLVAMDRSNYENILKLKPQHSDCAEVRMLMNYLHPGQDLEVPDPYYHGGFPKVYEMVDNAIEALIKEYN